VGACAWVGGWVVKIMVRGSSVVCSFHPSLHSFPLFTHIQTHRHSHTRTSLHTHTATLCASPPPGYCTRGLSSRGTDTHTRIHPTSQPPDRQTHTTTHTHTHNQFRFTCLRLVTAPVVSRQGQGGDFDGRGAQSWEGAGTPGRGAGGGGVLVVGGGV
jgi:hypothetical protein